MKNSFSPEERRPVPGRKWWITGQVVSLLLAMGITPNIASFLGMVLGLLAGLSFYLTRSYTLPGLWLMGALFLFFRSAFNIFDGMIAQKTQTATPWGGFVNDFTDRVADIALLVGFGYASHSSPTLGFLATISALLTATARTTGQAVGARTHYEGVMSKPVRMYVLILTAIIMAITPQVWLPKTSLVLVTAGSLLTVLYRIVVIRRELKEKEE